MTRTNANDRAWEKLFDKYEILRQVELYGYYDITATQIREFREPRLMGKVDHSQNLPIPMKENGLSLLTNSNSSYRVGPFEVFKSIPSWQPLNADVNSITPRKHFETLDYKSLIGEPGVINAGHASGILEDFCGEPLALTVSGKMGAPDFSFTVDTKTGKKHQIDVSGARIEIDAGFEGDEAFYLFEVKNHSADDFNLRQLYYPYRTWQQKISKPVIPIFLTYSNDIFDFYKFQFNDLKNYSSAELIQHKRYILSVESISMQDLDAVSRKQVSLQGTGEPFPQADDFEKVVDTVAILLDGAKSIDDLSSHYGHDARQSHYYLSAAKYLGLATSVTDETGGRYAMATGLAESIFSLSFRDKYLKLFELLLADEAIHAVYKVRRAKGSKLSSEEATVAVEPFLSPRYSGKTIPRRAQTAAAWVSWMVGMANKGSPS